MTTDVLDRVRPDAARSLLRHSLLNDWQRDFPIEPKPFDAIAAACGESAARVRAEYRRLLDEGAVSRIGGAFGLRAGGAGMLCAVAAPADRIDAVAARIDAEPGVNHNYEREHARLNLWFVATAPDAAALDALVLRIEAATGLAVTRLPMRRAYRIDLGFDLRCGSGVAPRDRAPRVAPPVPREWRAFAARLELGLPVVERPYRALGDDAGCSEHDAIDALRRWNRDGTLRRFGVIVRHHELGWASNAMVVFDVDDDAVDIAGARLAAQSGVHLCYRRERAPGWAHNLYCMVHGRTRADVHALIDMATERSGLEDMPREILFSTRRFKQTGSRYFAAALPRTVEAPR